MNVLYEQPLTILALGALSVAAALFALIKTGRIGFLYGAVGLIALTALLLIVERRTITIKEELRGVLDDISTDLTADNVPAVLDHIAPAAEDIRDKAEKILKQVRVDRVSIKPNLKVTPKNGDANHVVATFNAVAVGSERRGVVKDQPSPQFFTVEFVRDGDAWRILTYDRQSPTQGLR